MSGLVFRVKPEGFDRLVRAFDDLEGRIPRAIAQGLNEGGDKVRTNVMRALWKQTGTIKYASITSRIRTARGFGEGDRQSGPSAPLGASAPALTYQIIATGKGMPITEFPVSVTGKGVDAKPWGVDHLFKRSFATSKKGLLRARLGKARFPIRGFYGPALPKELTSSRGSVPSVFYLSTAAFVPPAILKRLGRVFP